MNNRKLWSVAATAAVVALTSAGQADTLYVDDDNYPGPGSGSEADPYSSIQDAIAAAVNGDEVVVAEGIYAEPIDFLGKAITVRSTDPADPAVVAATIIDGTGNLHVVQCVSGEGADTVLDGITITGGNANGSSFPDALGGGMYNSYSSPTVINCTFSGNSAKYGGGMCNEESNPTVGNCTFAGNTADDGGAMFNLASSVTLNGCTFAGNSADDDGGAIVNERCTTIFEDCTFTANSLATGYSHWGGAIFNNLGVNTMTRCTFTGNIAPGTVDSGGSAILSADTNQGGMGGALTHPDFTPPVEPLLLVNCTFVNNMSGSGGALHLQDTVATISNCDIIGNRAAHPIVAWGGGVLVLSTGDGAADVTMINTRVTGNSALDRGGGIYNAWGSRTA
ncbi:MAG: hypothetical protein ACYSU7_17260, partial [Planctomycetota bacterium]